MVAWVRRPMLVGGVVVIVLATALTVLVGVRATGRDPSRCERFAAAANARAAVVTGRGPAVLVIGDSWAVGLGLDRAADSWPARLDGTVHVAGFSGSGFGARASGCGAVAFADRADDALRAVSGDVDLVVVQGGLNDYDRPDAEIRAGFRRLLTELRGHPTVVVGPASAPARAGDVARVDMLLAEVARRRDVPYIRTADLRLGYLPDRLHLTATGHDAFGAYVRGRLDALVPG